MKRFILFVALFLAAVAIAIAAKDAFSLAARTVEIVG